MTETSATAILDAIADLGMPGSNGDARRHKSSRTHHKDFPVDQLVIDPAENYRWGSEAAMQADLARADLPLGDGEVGCTYELLRESIRAAGVDVPVGLVKREDGYHPIYGFTRCVAAREVGLATIPAYVYESTISEAEVIILQTRENSRTLKRAVNWVSETEQYIAISAWLLNQRLAKLGEAGEVGKQAMIGAHKACNIAACKQLGRHPSGMKSRIHFIHHLNPRIIEMSRQGYFSLQAAQEFHSGNVDNPYTPAFVTAVLKVLHGTDGYKPTIAPADVRRAVNGVKAGIAMGDIVLHDGSSTPAAPKRCRGHTMNRAVRAAREAEAKDDGADGAEHGPLSKMKDGDRIRQSPVILRDISELLAMQCLTAAGLHLGSSAEEVQAVVGGHEWHRIEGIGFGAGSISTPPLLETVLGGRKDTDPEIVRMRRQHEFTAGRYVTGAFIAAFVRLAMKNLGIRDLSFSDQGWLLGKTTVDGRPVFHRAAWADAVAAGLRPAELMLLERAKIAWAALKPLVKRGGK